MEEGCILRVALSLAICTIVYMLLFNNKLPNVFFYFSIFLLAISLLGMIALSNK
ncbi:hypothetical protein NCKUH21_03735 [Clostridioides difficile]|nr:hypothetical protein BER30_004348 [Clostridioides difficile]GAX66703.1 hypothetical protein NCKUH21_03735 [Clostridioides difficile]